jgi:small conductance mechanosensitive channel
MSALRQWLEADVVQFGLRALTALTILLLGLYLARRLASGVRRALRARGADEVLSNFLSTLSLVLLSIIVVVGALDRLGVPTASLLAALGAAGLAIGLALKDSLSQLAAGVLLIVTRPFRAGDFVEVAGTSGTVDHVDLLHTVLLTPDHRVISVPNSEVMANPIINTTAKGTRRVDISLPIEQEASLDLVMQSLQECARAHPAVLVEPAPQVVALRYLQGGVELSVRVWVPTPDVLQVQSTLTVELKRALDRTQQGLIRTIPKPTAISQSTS